MFGIETLGGTERAAVTVGLVLVEAIALYITYGAVTYVTAPIVVGTLAGD